MNKTIQVKSDDSAKRVFNLVVRGPVEKIVDIDPQSVYLEGKPGDTLEKVITITPSQKFPFSILEVKQKNNTPILLDWTQLENKKKSWQVNIKTTSDKAQNFYDVLEIKTDSKYKPLIVIRVYAVFIAPRKAPAKP